MTYKIEAVTTRKGYVLTFKIYERKRLMMIPYWKFMCNQCLFCEAERLVKSLCIINEDITHPYGVHDERCSESGR